MNKSAIVAAYQNFRKQHRLTISELVIAGQAAILMHGHCKEAESLELLVSEEMFDKTKRRLCRYENAKVLNAAAGEILVIGDLALYRGIPDNTKFVVINGITCCPVVTSIAPLGESFEQQFSINQTISPLEERPAA